MRNINIHYEQPSDLQKVSKELSIKHPNQLLIQAFCGICERDYIQTLIHEIRKAFPDSPLIGTTTAGEIIDGRSISDSTIISFTLFEHTKTRSLIINQIDDLYSTGIELGKTLHEEAAKLVILFGCGIRDHALVNSEPLLDGLGSTAPDTIIAGGQAGDNVKIKQTFVFTEQGITDSGIAMASLCGKKLQVNTSYNLSWTPIGKKMTVTKAEGTRLFTIDGATARDVYTHYLGNDIASDLPSSASEFPLILERSDMLVTRDATRANPDGSLDFMAPLQTGELVQFAYCDPGLIAEGAEETYNTIRSAGHDTIFIYSCVSRLSALGKDIHIELEPLNQLGSTAGFFSYGEYFQKNGQNLMLSQTMTILSLSEISKDNSYDSHSKATFPDHKTKQAKNLKVLHHLISVSANEIEEANQKLSMLAKKDRMTGLTNRGEFDDYLNKEINRLQRQQRPLSILLMDIDHFKLYNDTYGHVAGDDCLRRVAQVLGSVAKRPSDLMARYGGEEFVCVLPETDYTDAESLANKILHDIRELAIPHKTSLTESHITLSIGLSTVYCARESTANDILRRCDERLYQAKNNGRNQLCGVKDD